MMSHKSAYRAFLRRRGPIRQQQLTRGSSEQPSVLPDSLAENTVGPETLGSDGDSPSLVICRTCPRFLISKVEFHDPQVGASCDDAAEAGPSLCSLRVPEVLPSRSTGPPIRVGAPNFFEPHPTAAMGNIIINLTKFWENDVSLWFLMAEIIFDMRKIASQYQKRELLLSSSDLRHLQRVEHVLLGLNPMYPYSYLKAALVKIFGQTEEHQLDQLLYAYDLGDHKPTELLAEMFKLLGAKGSPVLLNKLFMYRLPSNVRRVLVAGPIDILDDVARRADRIVAEDRLPTSNPRFVATSDKLLETRLID